MAVCGRVTSDPTSPPPSPSAGPRGPVPTHPLCFQPPPFFLLEKALLAEPLSCLPFLFQQLLQLGHTVPGHQPLHLLLQLMNLLQVLGLCQPQPQPGSVQLPRGEGHDSAGVTATATGSLPDARGSVLTESLQLQGHTQHPPSSGPRTCS